MNCSSIFFKVFVVFLASGIFMSCSVDEIQPGDVDFGWEYFPLEIGQYRIYDVEDIAIYVADDNDSLFYQLKEVVADTFTNEAGTLSYMLERYKRASPDQPWMFDSIWTARRSEQQAVLVQSNIPYVKLKFPSEKGLLWDMNIYNVKDSDAVEIEYIDEASIIGGQTYDNTLKVLQNLQEDEFTFTDKRHEIYAANIGLAYKEIIYYDYCGQVGCAGEVVAGVEYKETLIEHGQE